MYLLMYTRYVSSSNTWESKGNTSKYHNIIHLLMFTLCVPHRIHERATPQWSTSHLSDVPCCYPPYLFLSLLLIIYSANNIAEAREAAHQTFLNELEQAEERYNNDNTLTDNMNELMGNTWFDRAHLTGPELTWLDWNWFDWAGFDWPETVCNYSQADRGVVRT